MPLLASALLLAPTVPEPVVNPSTPTVTPSEPLASPLLLAPPLAEPQRRTAARDVPTQLSWSFVELHGQRRSPDETREDLDGGGFRGAFELGQGLFVQGVADWVEDDTSFQRYGIGFGQHVQMHQDVHLFALASFLHLEIDDAGPIDGGKDGWRFEGGVRGLTDEQFEAELRIGWEDLVDDGFVWGVDVRWWLLPQLGLGAGYEDDIDTDVWTVGLRYAF